MLEAYKTVGFNVPLVVRLEGTEVEEGRQILAESKLDIIAADGLTDAAKKVVAAARLTLDRPLSAQRQADQSATAEPHSIMHR